MGRGREGVGVGVRGGMWIRSGGVGWWKGSGLAKRLLLSPPLPSPPSYRPLPGLLQFAGYHLKKI